MKADFDVSVFHTQRSNSLSSYKDVSYFPLEQFSYKKDDIVILFKNPRLATQIIDRPKKLIYWSSDVERPFTHSHIDHFVHLTDYHLSRNIFFPKDRCIVIPHGIKDIQNYQSELRSKEKDSVLYCSSPDRGLVDVLNDWQKIKKNLGAKTLNVTYGFNIMEQITGENTAVREFKEGIINLSKQEGINLIGKLSQERMIQLYKSSEYWILPLKKADSELFCLNALKTRLAGCEAIVRPLGALQNTVKSYIDYDSLIKGEIIRKRNKDAISVYSWDEVVQLFWSQIL